MYKDWENGFFLASAQSGPGDAHGELRALPGERRQVRFTSAGRATNRFTTGAWKPAKGALSKWRAIALHAGRARLQSAHGRAGHLRRLHLARRASTKVISMKSGVVVTAMGMWVASVAAHAQSSGAAAPAASTVEPAQLMQSMESAFGDTRRPARRNHIKGTCVAGEFVGTPAAAKAQQIRPFFGQASSRGRALLARGRGSSDPRQHGLPCVAWQWSSSCPGVLFNLHITMINAPTTPVRNPTEFNPWQYDGDE